MEARGDADSDLLGVGSRTGFEMEKTFFLSFNRSKPERIFVDVLLRASYSLPHRNP